MVWGFLLCCQQLNPHFDVKLLNYMSYKPFFSPLPHTWISTLEGKNVRGKRIRGMFKGCHLSAEQKYREQQRAKN